MALYKYDEKWYCEAKDLDLPRHALAIHLHRGRQGIGGFQNIRNPYYNGRNSKRLVLLESLPVELRRQVEAKLQAAGQQQKEALQLLEEEGAPSQEIAAVATQFTSSSVLHNAPALARALQTHIVGCANEKSASA